MRLQQREPGARLQHHRDERHAERHDGPEQRRGARETGDGKCQPGVDAQTRAEGGDHRRHHRAQPEVAGAGEAGEENHVLHRFNSWRRGQAATRRS